MSISASNPKNKGIRFFWERASLQLAFCLSVGLSTAPAQDVRAGLEHPGTPTLVTLGSKAGLDAQAPIFHALLAADSMLDLGLASLEVREDLPTGQALGAWLRQRQGLPLAFQSPQAWVLLGRDGRGLAAGGVLPAPEALLQALEVAGERNPVDLLKDFLKEHPGHAEAQMDLIRALQPRLQARLRKHPAASGQDLPPEEDALVWGPIARELDQLFLSEDWVGLNLSLDRDLLPDGVPERSSPLVKAIYRRNHAQFQASLRRFPENPPAWLDLLRMNEAVGEQGIGRFLEGIIWFRVRPIEAAMLPFGALAQRIHMEAEQTGNWRGAMAAELPLWRQLAQPKLALYGKDSLLPPGASTEESNKWSSAERGMVWTELIAPMIEAMVRSGSEGEVPALLGELDETWAVIGLETRLRNLAHTFGRPDLARSWTVAVQSLPSRVPREGLLGCDRAIFHQGQKKMEDQAFLDYDQPFRKQGMTASLVSAPASWAKRLGWSGSSPRWAMVDPQGRILLHGERLPSGEGLLDAYRAQGLPTDLECAVAFRREHPDHLGALAFEVRIRGTIAWANYFERFACPGPARGMDGVEREAWRAYFAALEQLLNDPLGYCPGLLRTAQVRFPTREELGKDAGPLGVEGLSGRLISRLESNLARRPSDMDLWWLWLSFAPHLDRSLAELLDSLAPSPMAPPMAWPPQEILDATATGLKRQERWQDLADLLQPRWTARRTEVSKRLQAKDPEAGQGYYQNWRWELTRALMEALLRLGRSREADGIMEAMKEAGCDPGDYERRSLCQVAKDLGEDSWAEKWSPKAPSQP